MSVRRCFLLGSVAAIGLFLTLSQAGTASEAGRGLGNAIFARPVQVAGAKCNESGSLDACARWLAGKGFLNVAFSGRPDAPRLLTLAAGCDSTDPTAKKIECLNSYFSNNPSFATKVNCGLQVQEEKVLDCLKKRGAFAPAPVEAVEVSVPAEQ